MTEQNEIVIRQRLKQSPEFHALGLDDCTGQYEVFRGDEHIANIIGDEFWPDENEYFTVEELEQIIEHMDSMKC